MKNNALLLSLLATLVVAFSGCAAIAGIFKAGMGVGIFITVFVIVIIIVVAVKLFSGGK